MNDNLIFDRKKASRFGAFALLLGFSFFIAGYFVGKRHSFQELMAQTEKESLTDQVYTAVSSLYDGPHESVPGALEELLEVEPIKEEKNAQAQSEGPRYYAQLASFPRLQDAQALVARLAKQDIAVDIKKVPSKSRQGRVVQWFQVITPSFANQEELKKLTAKIKKLEKIKDILIKKETGKEQTS